MSDYKQGDVIIPISSNSGFYGEELGLELTYLGDINDYPLHDIDPKEIHFKNRLPQIAQHYDAIGLINRATFNKRKGYKFIAFNSQTARLVERSKEFVFIPIKEYI